MTHGGLPLVIDEDVNKNIRVQQHMVIHTLPDRPRTLLVVSAELKGTTASYRNVGEVEFLERLLVLEGESH